MNPWLPYLTYGSLRPERGFSDSTLYQADNYNNNSYIVLLS